MLATNKQFKWQDDLIHQVGLSFFKKDWVIKEIVYHPMKFAKRRMEDPTDDRPIRIRYFAAFVLKTYKNKVRIGKFKEIYRSYDKYKDVVPEFNIRNDTEEHYRYDVQGMALKNIWMIDKIYEKGLLIDNQQPKT